MTFEEHEQTIAAARTAFNDAVYAAAEDGFQVIYEKWETTIQKTRTTTILNPTIMRTVKDQQQPLKPSKK